MTPTECPKSRISIRFGGGRGRMAAPPHFSVAPTRAALSLSRAG